MTAEELEAVGLRVKGQEWRQLAHAPNMFIAGDYSVEATSGRFYADFHNEPIGAFREISEAFEFCEAHHATRIAGELERIEG